MSFEEEYEDILQNIEFAIVSVYREDPALLDYDVDKALRALVQGYRRGGEPESTAPNHFNESQARVYARVKSMCDWRLGRAELTSEGAVDLQPPPVSPEEIVDCLSRIQKSVQKWTRRGGRQGYLEFIDEFIH